MPKCKGCKNLTGRNKVSYYVIPNPYLHKHDQEKFAIIKERAEKWLRNLKGGYDTTNFPFSRNQLICEEHFEPSMFKDDIKSRVMGLPSRKLLKEDAYPTIFENSIAEEKQVCLPIKPNSHLKGTEPQETCTDTPFISDELMVHAGFPPEEICPQNRNITATAQNRDITATADVGMQTGRSFMTESTVEVATQTTSRIYQIITGIERSKVMSGLGISHLS
eukprot:Seg149.4 transcript_id=Seg149.4/GoldUCD/mRNA.D3Y31 product="THAP domain-containing protein 5" protein_id=Seg149.4/GoldUCD/D3Y31